MIVVHRGAGMLAPGFGLLFALLINVLTFRIFGFSYYEDHKWPKLTVLVMAGLACLVVGILIKRKRKRDAPLEEQAINSLNPKFKTANLIAFSGPRDHLMYIPLQYWSIVYFGAAIIYVLLGTSATRPLTIVGNSNSHLSAATRDELRDEEAERIARKVKDVVLAHCKDRRGLIQAKEALAAMAAVVGERCMEAAGEIPVRTHDLTPGQRVFSDKVNVLLTGDEALDLAEISAYSVFGTIRDQLGGTKLDNHFPKLEDVFQGFAGGIGKPEDWGKVPLSIPERYWPEKLPLRVAFDTRKKIDAAVQSISPNKARILQVCTLAMVMMFKEERLSDQLDPAVALTLTFETINGIAKTVPMSNKAIDKPTQAMLEAHRQVLRMEPR